jgi:dTDP-glucose 4,6-dehydratase
MEDLKDIFERIREFWPREKTFLITGGTGFFGRWLVEAIALAEQELNSKNRFVVISRQEKKSLLKKIEALKFPFFLVESADLENLTELNHTFDFVIHAASDVSKIKAEGLADYSAIVNSTRNVLRVKNAAKLLYVSSGGVYKSGDYPNESDPVVSIKGFPINYSEAKVASELEVMKHSNVCIARCFSFVGPYADSNMVSMDMLKQKISDNVVRVKSPEVVRSYMYPTDLVVALLKLLILPAKHNVYNVGSPFPISLLSLAQNLAALEMKSEVQEADQESMSLAGKVYYPDTKRFDAEFGNSVTVSLDLALSKTYNFLTQRKTA